MGIFDPPAKTVKPLTISDVVFAIQEFHNDSKVFKGVEVDAWSTGKDGIKKRAVRYPARHKGCHGKLTMSESGTNVTCGKCSLNVNRSSANIATLAYRKEITLFSLTPEALPMKAYDKQENGVRFMALRPMMPHEAFGYYYPELKNEAKILLAKTVESNVEGVDEYIKEIEAKPK